MGRYMGAGSVGCCEKDEAYKKSPLIYMISGLLRCAFDALLEVEQPSRLHSARIAQTGDVDPR